MNRVIAAGLAGFAATLPMTIAMLAMHRRLPRAERYPLPPAELTLSIEQRLGVADVFAEPDRQRRATLAAHFGYGALAGAGYAVMPRRQPVVGGIAYGLGVWGASYLGWVPALRLMKPATRHPMRRNAMMLAAHVVWGGTTGWLAARLAGQPQAMPSRW